MKRLLLALISLVFNFFAINKLRPNLNEYTLRLLQDIDWLYIVRVNLITSLVVGISGGVSCLYSPIQSFWNMATNKDLEKRIETLEKEVQHIKDVLQYQMRNKKN